MSKAPTATKAQITPINGAAEFILTTEILQQLGVGLGDWIEWAVNERTLIVRPLNDVERTGKIAEVTRDIFDRRREAYLELAQGPE